MECDDILRELTEDELWQMLGCLRKHSSKYIRCHHLLYNYLKNLKAIKQGIQDDTLSNRWRHTFYGHRNGKIENCTYIAITPEKDYWINTSTVQESGEELLECIAKTKRINWSVTPISVSVDAEYFEKFNEIIAPKRNDWVYDKPEIIFHISKEDVRRLPIPKIPEGLKIGKVPQKLAKMIDDTWDYSYDGSREVIESSVLINNGTCLFREKDNEPITWIITNDFFAPGFLHTIASERRKGYGSLVSILEMKRIVEMHDVDIFVFIVSGNDASEIMHRKLGFKPVNDCRWIVKVQ